MFTSFNAQLNFVHTLLIYLLRIEFFLLFKSCIKVISKDSERATRHKFLKFHQNSDWPLEINMRMKIWRQLNRRLPITIEKIYSSVYPSCLDL
jgi:hypothetical protein